MKIRKLILIFQYSIVILLRINFLELHQKMKIVKT